MDKELDKFEKSLLKQLEKEHYKRNSTTISKCHMVDCWFKRMKALIEE